MFTQTRDLALLPIAVGTLLVACSPAYVPLNSLPELARPYCQESVDADGDGAWESVVERRWHEGEPGYATFARDVEDGELTSEGLLTLDETGRPVCRVRKWPWAFRADVWFYHPSGGLEQQHDVIFETNQNTGESYQREHSYELFDEQGRYTFSRWEESHDIYSERYCHYDGEFVSWCRGVYRDLHRYPFETVYHWRGDELEQWVRSEQERGGVERIYNRLMDDGGVHYFLDEDGDGIAERYGPSQATGEPAPSPAPSVADSLEDWPTIEMAHWELEPGLSLYGLYDDDGRLRDVEVRAEDNVVVGRLSFGYTRGGELESITAEELDGTGVANRRQWLFVCDEPQPDGQLLAACNVQREEPYEYDPPDLLEEVDFSTPFIIPPPSTEE